MSIVPVRVNYLNNKELLAEIHKSKTSFCYFIDKQYSNYDMIVNSLDEITPEKIEIAKERRAAQMMNNQKIEQKAQGLKLYQIKIDTVLPEQVQLEDLVWRVMTYDHIPLNENRTKKPKNEAEKHEKVNFPPFKHYIFQNDEFVEVGRSHWIDGIHNGRFCQDHGKINHKLACMFIKLVERYSQRSNWRGYCGTENTEALTQRGWLTMHEITENDTILSYSDNQLKWSRIKSIYRGDFDGLMHKITTRNMNTLVTPEHKLVTERGLIPAEYITKKDKIIFMGNAVSANEESKYSDSFVELIGWIVTEGNYQFCKQGNMRTITVYQNEGNKADRIRNCLIDLNYEFTERKRRGTQISFGLRCNTAKFILSLFPTKNLNMEFILSLTSSQRELLINTLVDGDGYRRGIKEGRHFDQKDKSVMDMFLALCTLSGYRTICNHVKMKSYDKTKICYMYRAKIVSSDTNIVNAASLNFHGGKQEDGNCSIHDKMQSQNIPTEYYKGKVWCPETEYGCFMARSNRTVYLTGNTYVSEMRGQALMQLSMVGLQFDENRSENPFAYLTVTISNAFTRVLNTEKRNQNIRDDILIMNGAAPSMTRQLNDEMAQKAANDAAEFGEEVPIPSSVVNIKRGAFGRMPKLVPTKKKIEPILQTDMWDASNKQIPKQDSSYKTK